MVLPAVKYVSVKDYLLLEEAAEEKHEYVGGNIVAIAGASREYNQIVSNPIRKAGSFFKGKGCNIFPSGFRVTTPTAKSYFYPGATIVCAVTQMQPDIFDTLLNPVVIFEAINEGSEKIDRGYKLFYYLQIPSLQEYVLIDSREYAIEIIRRQADGLWKFDKYFQADKEIYLASNCTLLFDDVYYQVQLPGPK